MVPGSLSKCESISLIYIDTNQTKLDLYPQKYPQPFHAGACFAIQKDLLLVGHLFGFRPMMSPQFGYSDSEYLDDERVSLLRRPTALRSVSIRAHPLGSALYFVLRSMLRFVFTQARPHRCRKPLCRLALAVVAITRLAR